MEDYIDIGWRIMEHGKMKEGRNGATRSLLFPQFKHDLARGFPLDTTREINFTAVKNELLWFLSGECHNVEKLNEMGTHIWDKWADENGWLGPIYGIQWRSWMGGSNMRLDQIHNAIQALQQDPYSRRILVTAWNPSEIKDMALPPCHVMFQLIYDGRLNLHLYQRSADWMIGVPYNIASYALLTHLIAQVTGVEPGLLGISYGDAHIYEEHVADAIDQLNRAPAKLPQLLMEASVDDIDEFRPEDIALAGYDPHPKVKYEVKE